MIFSVNPVVNSFKKGMLGKMSEGEVLKALLLRHCFDIRVNYIGNWIKTYHGVAE